MKKENRNRQHGFSLLEIILLIVLLGIGIPPLANLMRANLTGTGKMSQISNTTFCARQRMEQVISDYTSRGYAYVTTTGQYPSRTDAGVTTTVSIATSTWCGNVYMQVTVTASVPNTGSTLSLVTYLPRDIFP